MIRILLTVVSYVAATLAVQATSHFMVNADHYRSISIMRSQPLFALGITSMLIQGFLFALLFPIFNRGETPIRNGLFFSWAIGAFLASYIALAEPGKYLVPSIGAWIGVEATAAFAQFTLFGILLGVIHRRSSLVRYPATATTQ